jgi:hypothetical protein
MNLRVVVFTLFSLSLAGLGYYVAHHALIPSTEVTDQKVDGPTTVAPGATIKVTDVVTRNDDCLIILARTASRMNAGPNSGRDWVLQTISQTFLGDHIPRPAEYTVQLDPGMPDSTYRIFSRTRYFCDILDYAWPRVVDLGGIDITVETPAPVVEPVVEPVVRPAPTQKAPRTHRAPRKPFWPFGR